VKLTRAAAINDTVLRVAECAESRPVFYPSVSRANVTHFSTIELGALLRLSELVCHKEWHSRRKLFLLAKGARRDEMLVNLDLICAADPGSNLAGTQGFFAHISRNPNKDGLF
jgi:hypothetical protein